MTAVRAEGAGEAEVRHARIECGEGRLSCAEALNIHFPLRHKNVQREGGRVLIDGVAGSVRGSTGAATTEASPWGRESKQDRAHFVGYFRENLLGTSQSI